MSTIPNPNAPFGKLDANGRVIPGSFSNLAFQGEYSGTNLIFSGFARPGSSTGAEVWQIMKMTYDGSGNLLTITWPQNSFGKASTNFEFEWDERATYTYS